MDPHSTGRVHFALFGRICAEAGMEDQARNLFNWLDYDHSGYIPRWQHSSKFKTSAILNCLMKIHENALTFIVV